MIKFNQFMQAAVPYILSLYFLIIFPLFLVVIRDRRKNRSAKSDFQKKITEIAGKDGESLSYSRALRVGKGLGLNESQIHLAMNEAYSKIAGNPGASKIASVLDDIEKIDPYKSLPEDLKPALVQVEKHIELGNNKEASQLLIQPIRNHFVKYSELIDEKETLEKKSRRNTLLTVASAVIGAFGLIGTVSSPSASDIEALLEKNLSSQVQQNVEDESNNTLQPTAEAAAER